MRRVFIGNFDFEHRLAAPDAEPAANLKRLNAELATSWLALANDGDWIWTPAAIEPRFFEEAARRGLPQVIPVTSLADVPPRTECVPWGWSEDVRRLAIRFDWSLHAPGREAVRLANSRRTSHDLEQQWNVGLPQSQQIERLEQFAEMTAAASQSVRRWVVKAEFSMSARERILGQGPATESQVNWVRKRLGSAGNVYFEPWVERIEEAGIQFEIPQQGPPSLVGIAPMMVDARGQYAGSLIGDCKSLTSTLEDTWSTAIDAGLRAAAHLQSRGYYGPLGIDAMRYRDIDGSVKTRPLQDLNARWTMGRLSLGFRRLLNAGEQGFWQHGSNLLEHNLPFPPDRVLETSPAVVDGEVCRHSSRLIIGRPPIQDKIPAE